MKIYASVFMFYNTTLHCKFNHDYNAISIISKHVKSLSMFINMYRYISLSIMGWAGLLDD